MWPSGTPVSLGPLRRGPVHAAARAARPGAGGADHDRGPVPGRRPGTRGLARLTTPAAKFYQVYSVPSDSEPDLRISHVGYDRVHTSAEDINTYFPLARLKEAVAAGRIGPWPRGLRRADQPQPPGDDGDRRPGASAPLSGGRSRRRRPRPQLTGVPPDRESGRPAPGGARHPDRDHGLRQGHRRALRRAALPVQRFPAGQLRRPAVRRESQAQTLELALRVLETAPAARTTVQSPLRWSEDAAWKRDYLDLTEALPGDDRRAAQGVRRGEGRGQGQARGLMSKPFAGVRILDFTRYLAGPTGPTSWRCSAPTW